MTQTNTIVASQYIESQRKEYSLYVLQSRAIPYAADGLRAAARRILWTARDGKKYKSATLAGATMPIHPHQSPEGTVNTLASPYTNNIPLLTGIGAFGTLLKPTAYGAARYTSVLISEFTKDVVLKDIEIIPMQNNYDDTLQEPIHFLPLIPIALLNPQEGIAVGFATNILPRDLIDIINDQLKILTSKQIKKEPNPTLNPIHQKAAKRITELKWLFEGAYEKVNSSTIRVTNLPYGGLSHEKYIEKLTSLEESGIITNVEDKSKNYYDIIIKFKKGFLSHTNHEELLKLLNLESTITENLNVINFDCKQVWSPTYIKFITEFTNWRLSWYKTRYERLAKLLELDIQRYKDILTAIRKNVGSLAKKIQSRAELKNILTEFNIVHVDYIADLPVYKFTEQEKQKTEIKLKDAKTQLSEYKRLIKSKSAQIDVYANELQQIKTKYKKGKYENTTSN